MVGESCFEGVLCKTDVGLRWFVVICFDRCLVDYGRLKAITVQRTVSWLSAVALVLWGMARQLETIKHCLFGAFSDCSLAPRVGGGGGVK